MSEIFNRILRMKYGAGPGKFGKGRRFLEMAIILSKVGPKIINCFVLDGNIYTNEYIQISSITATGTSLLLEFSKGYLPTENIQLSSITATGVYCDINGIPV